MFCLPYPKYKTSYNILEEVFIIPFHILKMSHPYAASKTAARKNLSEDQNKPG